MSPVPVVLQVFVFKNGEFVGTDLFTEREIVVGRDGNAGLVLDSTSVARNHAVIEHDGERVFVRDGGGSTNGIYINGRRIDRCEVGRLDQVVVGEFSLKLKIVSKSGGPTAAPSDAAPAIEPQRRASEPTAEPVARAPAARPPSPEPAAEPPLDRAPAFAPAAAKTRAVRTKAPDPDAQETRVLPQPSRPAPQPEPSPASGRGHVPTSEARAEHHPHPARAAASHHAAASLALADTPAPLHVENEDEEDDEPYVPSFSMLRQAIDTGTDGSQATHIQVIVARGDRITEIALLRPGETFLVPTTGRGARRRRLVVFKGRGEGKLLLSSSARGQVLRDGRATDLSEAATPGRSGTLSLNIVRGETVNVEDDERSYHVSFLRPPQVPPDTRSLRERLRPDRMVTRSFGSSIGGHLLLLLLGVLMPAKSVAPPAETESFAEVKLDKEVTLEEPPPAPPAPKEAEAPPQPAARPVSKRMEAAPNKRSRAGGTAKAPPGVLGLLSKVGSSAAPGPAAALAAVSNLSAANAPAGARGFRVSGLTSNLATADILVGGGGGGGLVTKGGAALLRGGGGGAGQLSGKGTRGVGGMVQKMPQAMRSAGQGSLDRDAIQKVINQNVSQIQRCYERELLSKPGLSGKVEVEWTVTTSGSVRSARQKFASLESTTAVNCILDRIRTWRFPQPKGGEVVVSYPFVFKSISF